MQKIMKHTLAVLLLWALLMPGMPAPTVAKPTLPQEAGVYEEDFTAHTYKDYVENVEWDTEAHALRLASVDGASQEYPAAAVDGSGHTIVVWQDKRSGDWDIYAQKLDTSGEKLWADDVRVNSDSGTARQRYPDVAVDGSGNAMVVWEDGRNDTGDVYAQKLDGSGNKLWAADVHVNDTYPGWQEYPSIGLDEGGNGVVVWLDWGDEDIYAQRLDTDGNMLWAADVRVNGPGSWVEDDEPAAVTVDGSGSTFVVWTSGTDIYAQRLDTSGNRMWTSDLQVNAESETACQEYPSVDVDGGGNAIVAWQHKDNGDNDVYAQRLDASGNRLWASDLRVNSESGLADQQGWRPTVAVDESGQATIAWRDCRDGIGDIYAQRVATTGSKLWAADVRVNAAGGGADRHTPAVAVERSGSAVVLWRDERSGTSDIYAQRLDADGAQSWPTDLRVNADDGTASQVSPAVEVDGSGGTVIVWEDNRKGNDDIYAQRFDASGSKLWAADVRVNSDGGTAEQTDPAVAVDDGGHIVVVWRDLRGGNNDIYAQRLDTNGNRLWTTDMRVNAGGETAGQGPPDVAVDDGGNAVIVWGDFDNGDSTVYAQRLDTSGSRSWATDLCVNYEEEAAWSARPAVAADGGGNAVVVWQQYNHGRRNIYAQKTDANGNLLWADGVRVDDGSSVIYRWYPDVAADGSGYAVVVWMQALSGEFVCAQRLDANGSRLWAADIHVDSDSEAYGIPAVALDGGGNAVVAWPDRRSGDYDNYDIYAQKLSTSGGRLWSADVLVNVAGPADQRRPAVATDGSGNAVVAWQDNRNGNDDVYAQKINPVGSRGWLADLQVVYPDQFYFPAGAARSATVDVAGDTIAEAALTAQYILRGGNLAFYLTNDGGVHWAEVTPGTTHVFTTAGSDLRWRVGMAADLAWSRTPIVDSLRIEYSTDVPGGDDYEPDDTCAQASPLQVNGAVQAHTFHQPDDEDWAWFHVVSGTTYVLQTAHAGPNADTVLELHDICDHPILTDTNAFGHDARLLFTAPSDSTLYARVTNQDGSVYGEGTDYDLSVRTYHPNGLAVVVAGHNDAWQLQSNIDYAADHAYLTLLEAGFPKANVRYLGPDPDRDVDGNGLSDDIAATATITDVRYAVQDWPREQGLALGVPFYVYLMDHGHYDQFLANGNAEKVTAPLLDLWLSNLEATTGADQITVVIDACKSGSFIDVTDPGPAEISGLNRVVVASTTSQANAYPSQRGSLFSDVFWTALGDNQDVWSAYRAAKAAVDARGLMQTPWLDDNGDAVANEEDGDLARGRGLAGVFGGSEPVIDWLTVGEVSASGTATVSAQVRDDFAVAGVHVEVYPPGYEEPEAEPGETPVVGVPTTTLTLAGGDTYTATLTGLAAPGSYRVVGYAVDDEGNWALPRWALVRSGRAVYLPLVTRSN